MQYDQKNLKDERIVSLTWHGKPTLVLLEGDAAKTEIDTGATVKVSHSQALSLVRYSHLWTLEGDKPVEHGFEGARIAAFKALDERAAAIAKRRNRKAGAAEPETPAAPLTGTDIDMMKDEKEIREALKARKIKASRGASMDELKALLKETVAEEPAAGETEKETGTETGEEAGTEGTEGTESEEKEEEKS